MKPSPARFVAVLAALAAAAMLAGACSRDTTPAYTPGLGEIMTLQQMRHAKLWWAGDAGNWALASYELDELQEGFADAVRYHPTVEGSPVPIAEILPEVTHEPLDELRKAIDGKDAAGFAPAFDGLTAACNACHRATKHGFNVVKRPKENTFSNQDFAPPDGGR